MKLHPLCLLPFLALVSGGDDGFLRKQPQTEQMEEEKTQPEKLEEEEELGYATKVSYLYTYGAPSVSKEAIGDPTVNSWQSCVPGNRVYTKNYYAGRNYADAAAEVTDMYPHPTINAVELFRHVHDDRYEYFFEECESRKNGRVFNDRKVWWYPRSAANTPYWPIHNQGIYQNRFYELRNKMPNSIFEPTFNYTKFTRCINTKPYPTNPIDQDQYRSRSQYENCLDNMDIYETDPYRIYKGNWNEVTTEKWDLIAYVVFDGNYDVNEGRAGNFEVDPAVAISDEATEAPDTDRVAVLKKDRSRPTSSKTTDCVLVFQGSGGGADLARFMDPWLKDYCGWRVHGGITNELRNIIKQPGWKSTIAPALQKCSSLTVVGHSLGGALADAFTMCVNFGDKSSSDFTKLKWW